MALIECHECGHKISESAESCPNCGYINKTPAKNESTQKIGLLGLSQIVFPPMVMGYVSQSWWVFGLAVLGMLVLEAIPLIGELLQVLVTAAVFYYWINLHFGFEPAIVLGGLVALAGIGSFAIDVSQRAR